MASVAVRSAAYEALSVEEENDLREDVLALISTARTMRHARVRAETLKIAWFLWTERGKTRNRKIKTRYRTPAAMTVPGVKVSHEHVVVREFLSWAALQEPWLVEVLMLADGCLVTKDEHDVLAQVPATAFGWERYLAAGFAVVDTASGAPADLAELASHQQALRRKIEQNCGARWPATLE